MDTPRFFCNLAIEDNLFHGSRKASRRSSSAAAHVDADDLTRLSTAAVNICSVVDRKDENDSMVGVDLIHDPGNRRDERWPTFKLEAKCARPTLWGFGR